MANTFLVGARSYGYKTAATATAFVQNIDPISGARLAVTAFGFTCAGPGAQKAYFLSCNAGGRTSIVGAVSAGLSTVILTADPGVGVGNSLSASDMVCIALSYGTYQYTTVSTYATATGAVVFASALTVAVAAGAPLYDFGVYSDVGHMPYALTASAQSTKDTAGAGIFFAAAKGDPMIVYMLNPGSQIQTIDYLSINGING